MSLVETAKANGLEPYAWLRRVMRELPAAKTVEDVDALLPWNLHKQDLASELPPEQGGVCGAQTIERGLGQIVLPGDGCRPAARPPGDDGGGIALKEGDAADGIDIIHLKCHGRATVVGRLMD